MKWLVIPTQSFSPGKLGKERAVTLDNLPWIVKLYLKFFKNKVFIIHDEISWIKTNQPMPEYKKSTRSRVIKLLEQVSEARCGLTGTLLSKSPVNIIDPYRFLSSTFFEDESPYDIAETYTIQMSLRSARGRRVMISQKEWYRARKRMLNAFKLGGETQLNGAKNRIHKELGISLSDCEHILTHRTYMPFINIDRLMKRVESVTMTVNREDIFDIKPDKFVYKPIMRPVEMDPDGLKLANELIKVGFTDRMELGKAPALELMSRLQDLCNGYEPVMPELYNQDAEDNRMVKYEPLPSNPKLEELLRLLDEIDVAKNQVVVWCYRRNAFDGIERAFTAGGIPYASYSGAQTAQQKAEAEEAITDGSARVFLANPGSASFGLNCLKRVNYLIWYCIGGSVEQYIQAQHRILRGQSLHPKYAYHISIKGSVEERNLRSLAAGKELMGASNTKDVFAFRRGA